jgi:aminoglycoside 3-N-acetyltransferase
MLCGPDGSGNGRVADVTALASGDLRVGLEVLGLGQGADVLIHCGMRRIGHLEKGPQTILEAVQSVIGPRGTVVVPTGTANNSNTSPIFRAATAGMDPAEVARFEANMVGFDPATTVSFGMGTFAEWVRTQPGAQRSAHPQTSFAALGPKAWDLTRQHRLECHLGEESPLGALYAIGAMTLLLGVGYDSCTALHLAEYRRSFPPKEAWHRCFVIEDGQRVQRDFLAPKLDPSCFADLGEDLDRQEYVISGMIGDARSRLMPIKEAVDFAVGWMDKRYGPY